MSYTCICGTATKPTKHILLNTAYPTSSNNSNLTVNIQGLINNGSLFRTMSDFLYVTCPSCQLTQKSRDWVQDRMPGVGTLSEMSPTVHLMMDLVLF